jgi:Zn-dependent peptidase ImmA (M78 family)
MTQAGLAEATGFDPEILAGVETGSRALSPGELMTVAGALGLHADWFFNESPAAVVSRRRDPVVGGFSWRLDVALELAARDVAFAVRRGIIAGGRRDRFSLPSTYQDAEDLARVVRIEIGRPDGPLPNLQATAESLGLLCFSLDLGRDAGDAACVEVGDLGVAVVNGLADPGRRRFSLAHEMAHHLAGDAYEPSPRLGASDSERMINAFAAYLLMPQPAVLEVWDGLAGQEPRRAAVAVAVRFSVSWTAACNQLANLGLIDSRERDRLADAPLRKGELVELGERYVTELDPPSVPPGYARAVVTAYRQADLTAAKAVDLLRNSISEDDLPEQDPESLDDLREELGLARQTLH